MGTRYFLELDCPHCGKTNTDVYYAPTCDMTDWRCEHCSHIFDIERFFRVEDTSNAEEIKVAMDAILKGRKSVNWIEHPLHGKSLDEMSKDELKQIVLHTRDKLAYGRLKRKSLGWQLSESHMRQSILKRKLRITKQAVNILRRLRKVELSHQYLGGHVAELQRAAKPILMKWDVLK